MPNSRSFQTYKDSNSLLKKACSESQKTHNSLLITHNSTAIFNRRAPKHTCNICLIFIGGDYWKKFIQSFEIFDNRLHFEVVCFVRPVPFKI